VASENRPAELHVKIVENENLSEAEKTTAVDKATVSARMSLV